MHHQLEPETVHYTWRAGQPPVIRIEAGDTITLGTRDGFDAQLADLDADALRDSTAAVDFDRIAPLTGPIFVEGAEAGTTLEVEILTLEPIGDGYAVVWPQRCGFDFHRPTAMPLIGTLRRFPEEALLDDHVSIGKLKVPVRPMLGIIGTAPERGEFRTLPPREFGGNMDCRLIGAGATVLLPVFQEGALLSLGDGHAAQGDGEICTTGIECAMRVKLRVSVASERPISGPELRMDGSHTVISYGLDLDGAARDAIERMHRFLVDVEGLDATDAYLYLGLAGDLEINQVVDTPHVGVRLTIPVHAA